MTIFAVRRSRIVWLMPWAIALLLHAEPSSAKSAPQPAPKEIDVLYENGVERLSSGDSGGAIVQFKNLLQQDPNHLPARIALGKANMRKGDAAAAEKELRIALGLGASRDQVFPVLGNALLAQRKYAEILTTIKSTLPGRSRGYEICLLRGRAHFELGQLDEATSQYEQAHKLAPQRADPLIGLALIAQAQSASDKALQLVTRAVEIAPRDSEAWFRQGEILVDKGNDQAARTAFDQALTLKPNALRVHLARASLHLRHDEIKLALADVEAVRELNPDDISANFLLWQIHEKGGESDAARADLAELVGKLSLYTEQALNTEPLLLRIAALVRYANRDLTRAATALQYYVTLRPNDIAMRRLYGQVMLLLGEAKAAIDSLYPLYRQAPGNRETLLALGQAYLQIGRYAAAGDMFEQARKLDPNDEALAARIALSNLGTGNIDEAMNGLKDAVERKQAGASAPLLLSVLQIKAGHPKQAVSIMATLAVQAPRDPKVHNVLGVAHSAAGDIVQARASFETAHRLAANYFPPIYNLARLELAAGDVTAARARLEAVVAKDPRADTALLALADIATNEGDQAGAVRWLDKAVAATPNAIAAQAKLVELRLSLGQNAEALTVAVRMVDHNPENAQAVESLALAELANHKSAQATKHFRDAVRYAGFDGARLMRIAVRQVNLEDFEEARRTLLKATNTPASDEAMAALIRLEIQTGDEAGASKRIAALRSDDASNALAELLSGELAMKRHDPVAARVAYEAAQKRLPSTAGLMGLVDTWLATNDLPRALQALEDWRKVHPDDQIALQRLALVYLPMRRLDDAQTLHEKLLVTSPDDPVLLGNLARLYQIKGDPRARALAERALAAAPESSSTLDTLGWILVTEKDTAKGLSLLRDAIARQDNPLIRYHLAQALQELGRTAEAKAELGIIIQGGQPRELVEDVKRYYDSLSMQH